MSAVILTSAEGMDEAAEQASLIVLHITRREVERGHVGDIVDRLMHLSDRADFTRRFANAIALSVDGYNEDPRELAEIPEVVALFRAIDEQWPYWFHFMALEDRSLDTVLLTLIGTERIASQAEQIAFHFDPELFRSTFLAKIKAMNRLHDLHRLDANETREISDRVLARINEILD